MAAVTSVAAAAVADSGDGAGVRAEDAIEYLLESMALAAWTSNSDRHDYSTCSCSDLAARHLTH